MKIKFINHSDHNEILDKGVLIFLVSENKKIPNLLSKIDKEGIIDRILASDNNFHGKNGQILVINSVNTNNDYILIVGTGVASNINELSLQNAGSNIASKLNSLKKDEAVLYVEELENSKLNSSTIATHLALGIKSRNYAFTKYYSAKLKDHELTFKNLTISLANYQKAEEEFENRFNAVVEGMYLARDLVNEPGNIIYPESFAEKCKELSNLGVKVTILGPSEMKELGMRALLGVAQGSSREARLVVLEWEGNKNNSQEKPIAFVGKGVTFDTGGINLKPSSHIADMKYDMAGAAAVTGLMYALAKRKAKVNALGVLGLVENMPSGTAQRPSDVVFSMSGQSIEVDNTDAEGRLVLADAIWYTKEKYNPELIIDLATLTGAIVMALGDAYAGLFSNDDELAKKLISAGNKAGELVWQLPMGEHYDKQINSEIADVKNTGQANRGGGSITAAQFLNRFVKECKWAHLDIAGTAWNKFNIEHSPKGATGFGVKLLEEFIHSNYENL